ncbi:hypothetical protein [Haliangium sp.]|uniref:hypothetical protein n=1 Tax=Haliangium sp. TaxID=2663208 RepID=UPI003D0B9408
MGNEIVMKKLINAMGPTSAKKLMKETLAQLGLVELKTADDRLHFGSALITRGGVGKLIGQSIMMQARLHGAHG